MPGKVSDASTRIPPLLDNHNFRDAIRDTVNHLRIGVRRNRAKGKSLFSNLDASVVKVQRKAVNEKTTFLSLLNSCG